MLTRAAYGEMGMPNDAETGLLLAGSAGFRAIARDGPLGAVETPLFPPDAREPDFLVLRTGSGLRVRRPIVSTALVEGVDPDLRVVRLALQRKDAARLPEHVPIAI
jgi:hypothetical protein